MEEAEAPIRRGPFTQQALRSIADAGVEIGTVIDVGVLDWTPKLRTGFPGAHHILIEPSPTHRDAIARNYDGVSHQLIQVAASDVDGDAFLVDWSIDRGDVVTHSTVVETRAEAEAMKNVLEIHDLPLRRLDTILKDVEMSGHVLLKIDVDGHEMKVLGGAPETLRRADFVMIEAQRDHLLERCNFLADAGFKLFEIVDICYYKGVLWQADLFFVRADVRDRLPGLRPSTRDPNVPFDRSAFAEFEMDVIPTKKAKKKPAKTVSPAPAQPVPAVPRRRKSAASRLWKRIRGR